MRAEYRVVYSDQALKALRKMDSTEREVILGWINKNLVGCSDPRAHGKALAGERSEEWRYRIGSYRILAEIDDDQVTVEVIKVGHRSKVYRFTS